MNINFEAIEKAWFKPKKTAFDKLEDWINDEENSAICYDCESKYDYVYTDDLLTKIQELKKENENGHK